MPALLAPVPAVHLEDGVAVFKKHGLVAFGTDYVDLFRPGGPLSPGMTVYIYASASGHDGKTPSKWIGRVAHSATLAGIAESVGGKCPWPELRGERAAKDDGKFGYFWRVTDLSELKPFRTFSSFKSLNTKKALSDKPERALLVFDND
jgi:hypothetical protein